MGYDRTNRFEQEVSDDRVDLVLHHPDPTLAAERVRAAGALSYQFADGYSMSLQAGAMTGRSELQLTSGLRDSTVQLTPATHLMGVIETPYGQVRASWNHTTANGGPT